MSRGREGARGKTVPSSLEVSHFFLDLSTGISLSSHTHALEARTQIFLYHWWGGRCPQKIPQGEKGCAF